MSQSSFDGDPQQLVDVWSKGASQPKGTRQLGAVDRNCRPKGSKRNFTGQTAL